MKPFRAPQFLFEPEAFAVDPVVLAMSPAGRGAYVMLLCAAWRMAEPGVITPAIDQVLSALAMVDTETWRTVRGEVAAAFDTESRPGAWVQKRMVQTHAEQSRWIDRSNLTKTAGGKARAQAAVRREDGRFSSSRPSSRNPADHPAGVSSADPARPALLGFTDSSLRSESATEPSLRSGSVVGGEAASRSQSQAEAVQSEPRARGHANGAHSLAQEPADGFADWYAAYPRHVAKLAAQRAYRTALKRTTAEILLAGAKRYAAATAATDPDKIKHPATWLNGGCWEDERAGPRASRGRAIMEFGLQLKAQEEAS